MSVVVEQTLPFSPEVLDLHNDSRWHALMPLIRPSIGPLKTGKGCRILVDNALSKNQSVQVAAVVNAGSFSSKLLDDPSVLAIAQGDAASASDLEQALQASGAASRGLIIVRVATKQALHKSGEHVVIVDTQDELEQDHVLHLLGSASEECRSSLEQTMQLLQLFVERTTTTHSIFHTEKTEHGHPAVVHASGVSGFEKAKDAVERDMRSLLDAQHVEGTREGTNEVTYSVHYSDVNGLSRLETYIVAGVIGQYLETQNITYRLSHSTISNPKNLARGYSISLCLFPSRLLPPQSSPQRHQPPTDSSHATAPPPPSQTQQATNNAPGIPFTPSLRTRIEAACNALIAAEPQITSYDTVLGDGDCGYTLRDGAKQVLSHLATHAEKPDSPSTLSDFLTTLITDLERTMGGTSGALYCIFLTALSSAAQRSTSIAAAAHTALEDLMKYTPARVGDRTLMDTLIPYITTLASSGGDEAEALRKALEGMEATKGMKARLGRSTYLDEEAVKREGVPDPGAYGVWVLVKGLTSGGQAQ